VTAALEVASLVKEFGGLRAVDGVSLRVAAGERRVLIGPNGAGKTTLFHCVTGTLAPTAGRVTLFGRDVTRLAEHRRTALGMGRTFQISNVIVDLSCLENLVLAALGKGKLLLLGLTKSTTLFTMLLSMGVYWTAWGWRFALGLVLSIYVHEMGHVAALQRYGIKATAPMFIPGFAGYWLRRTMAPKPGMNMGAVAGIP